MQTASYVAASLGTATIIFAAVTRELRRSDERARLASLDRLRGTRRAD